MKNIQGFVAYPSTPVQIGEAVSAAVRKLSARSSPMQLSTWEESDIAGRFIAETVLSSIDQSDFLVADITRLNFNVTFEIGYAIGRRKRVILLRNASITGSDNLIREVGVYDTLGYERYDSSEDLANKLRQKTSEPAISIRSVTPNRSAPVYLVLPRYKSDHEIRMSSRVKKARLQFRSFDPEEHGRLPAGDAIENVAQSLGVVTSLLPTDRVDSAVHNFRAAFIAGLAMGMDKALLLLQQGEDPVPLDYRDLVHAVHNPTQIDKHIADFSSEVAARLQTENLDLIEAPQSFLERLNLGTSSAENELRELGKYYLETDEFRRVLRGEIRVVTGRKGAGKTALFLQVRDRLRSSRDNVVLDLRPEGFQLLKFKERVLDYLEGGTKEHTITAFWEYLLLLETCHKILAQDEVRHMRDPNLYEPYRRLAETYQEDRFVAESDFAERMLKLTKRVADDFESHGGTSRIEQHLTTGEITDLLYKHDISQLRREVTSYLSHKDNLWMLIDNLDKGWPAHGLMPEDVLTLRCLIDALGRIERLLAREQIDAHGVVFIRNDVYELLVANTPDRGKVAQVRLDWTDEDLLREILRRRFLRTSGIDGRPGFQDLWTRLCATHIGAEESSQYLIERCLMRPRALIELVGYCRAHAVNLGHDRIMPDDIAFGEATYSVELFTNIGFEIQDVFPAARDVLYEFLETPVQMNGRDILAAVGRAVGDKQSRKLFELLLWYGIFGVVVDEERVSYIYNANYDLKRLLKLAARRGGDDAPFRLNPAFWTALEAQA